jgi:acetoacetyl-CoA synthetase
MNVMRYGLGGWGCEKQSSAFESVSNLSLYPQAQTTLISPLTLLKAGTGDPVFITHGMSGDANFSELARQTRTNHPIYGIRAKLALDPKQPFDRIEDIARHHVEVIRTIQPKGPYALIGYSFGGLVALEMSRCLLADGENVALLALLDTYPHSRYLPPAQRLRLALRRTRSHLSRIKRLSVGGGLSYCGHALRGRLHRVSLGTRPPADTHPRLPIKDRNYAAFRRYRPQFYPGKINFVRAEVSSFQPSNPIDVWGQLVAEMEVAAVPGDHLDIVDRHYQTLGPVLSRYLERALDQRTR